MSCFQLSTSQAHPYGEVLVVQQRLQKIIAAAGVTSRRKAEELIRQGRVTLNGHPASKLGTSADPEKDRIEVDGVLIRPEKLEYYLVNKPQGVLSSVSDPEGRPVVTDLIRSSRRLYPAGRLDFQSEGLMILTNDGGLTRKLTGSGQIEKLYRVKVRGQPRQEMLQRLRQGVRIRGERFSSCRIALLKKGRNCWYQVGLFRGKNRQIRRMFDHIGHPVMRLRRVSIGPILLGDLSPGASRKMTAKEVRLLKTRMERRQETGGS